MGCIEIRNAKNYMSAIFLRILTLLPSMSLANLTSTSASCAHNFSAFK